MDPEREGIKLLSRYNHLKRRLEKTTALLLALRGLGGPREKTEHSSFTTAKTASRISTESVIREIMRIAKERESVLTELVSIEGKIEALPDRLMRLIQWRYILFAKREAIASRMGISIRHFSRLKKKALILLGESVENLNS